MSAIKAKLREQAAEFISLRESLELLTEDGEGCTMKEAATFLCQVMSKQKSLLWQVISWGDITTCKNDENANSLLDAIVKNGLKFSTDDFYSISDCDEYGFLRADLIESLAAEGVHLSGKYNTAPAWAKACKGIRRFTLRQAARVLIKLDPLDNEWPVDDEYRELERIYTALSQAADDGDFLPFGLEEDGRSLFRVQDLRAWAESVGLHWCIPSGAPVTVVAPLGAADDASRDRLRQLEAENAHLVGLVQGMDQALREAEEELKRAPQETAPAPQQATAGPQDDEWNPLHPKRETTYLNTIGALVELIQTPRPERNSEAAVIREVVDNYGDRPGIAKRTLEGLFAEAKRRVQSV